jgi:hypothetical protein
MEVKMNRLILVLTVIIYILTSQVPLVHSQPQGYTLVYSPPRAYYVDWMDVKAVYVKEEGNRLYFYIEYYGAIPSSRDYKHEIYIYMDTDRNSQTGQAYGGLGLDYYIYFFLWGDNSDFGTALDKWDHMSNSWKYIKSLNARLAPGLSYMEIWVDEWDIEYIQSGIDFYIESDSYVKAMPETELSYVIGSLVKQITVDGEPDDWGFISPLKTFPSREINPPEFEVSSVYVANDDENLYIRLDVRGKPSTTVNAGKLERRFVVYLDADNNDNTGCIWWSGSEFRIDASFYANMLKYTQVAYKKYAGMYSCIWEVFSESWNAGDFNSIFEFKIPLSIIGVETSRTVGLYIVAWSCGFDRYIPQSGYLTYLPDTTPPVTAIALSEPKHQAGLTTYVSGSTLFTLLASDDASGVKETRYRIDGGSWTTYSSGFTLSTFTEGKHTIGYYSIDNVDNAEAEKNFTIILDKTPPTISDASPTGTISSTSVTFSVKVEDAGSGVKEVKLIVDSVSQGSMAVSGNTYSKTVSLLEGSHTWSIEAVDNVNNAITKSYSLTIATGPPMEIVMTAIILTVAATMSAIILLVTYKEKRRIRNLDEMIRKVKEFLEELEEKD